MCSDGHKQCPCLVLSTHVEILPKLHLNNHEPSDTTGLSLFHLFFAHLPISLLTASLTFDDDTKIKRLKDVA